ncbi:MAG TPA: aryl-sulfate sulfohydrolase, partial [Verrucomicrobiales bacterium]|nr:aryl-sulfate sulfohydrolase [Verrucomicrobiales bacterium]
REGDWKLIQFFESDSVQLFNLESDLGEKSDLAKSNPEKANALLAKLKIWQVKTKAAIPAEANPDFGSSKKK